MKTNEPKPFISEYPDIDIYCLKATKEKLEGRVKSLQKKQSEHEAKFIRDTWLDENVLATQRVIAYCEKKIAAVEAYIEKTGYPTPEIEE